MEIQYYKGTEDEVKVYEAARPILDLILSEKVEFYNDAFNSFPLGDVIFEDQLSPLANGIEQGVFRAVFNEIFTAFESAGTFESYLSVFRRIFGDTVDVEFTVPSPGRIEIDITADSIEIVELFAREIVNSQYVLFNLVDEVDDILLAAAFRGIETQYELEQLLRELVPAGIFAEITLTIGA